MENENTKIQAYYHRDNNRGYINLILNNIIDVSIPYYAFEYYKEIAGLLISEIVFHEIGHHVHFNKRHGIKKSKYENFADNYARAGYGAYLTYRKLKILSSYKWASLNIFLFNREERQKFSKARQELINYLSNIKGPIVFP